MTVRGCRMSVIFWFHPTHWISAIFMKEKKNDPTYVSLNVERTRTDKQLYADAICAAWRYQRFCQQDFYDLAWNQPYHAEDIKHRHKRGVSGNRHWIGNSGGIQRHAHTSLRCEQRDRSQLRLYCSRGHSDSGLCGRHQHNSGDLRRI